MRRLPPSGPKHFTHSQIRLFGLLVGVIAAGFFWLSWVSGSNTFILRTSLFCLGVSSSIATGMLRHPKMFSNFTGNAKLPQTTIAYLGNAVFLTIVAIFFFFNGIMSSTGYMLFGMATSFAVLGTLSAQLYFKRFN